MSKMPDQIRVVCITGPFGSGKTSLARLLQKEYGIPTLYMDLVGHYLLTRKYVIDDIVRLLGEGALIEGKISRKLVAARVFSNRQMLEAYNNLLWTYMDDLIGKWIPEWLNTFGKLIIEAAVLYEAGWFRYCDRTIAVLAPVKEILRRKNMDLKSYCRRRRWQLPDREYFTRADLVLCNRGTPDEMLAVAREVLSRWGFLSSNDVYDF